MPKIIAICNQKGGVGKTTTAINLSTFLTLEKKKILLVDLDPQGNTTSGLGVDKTNLQKTSYDVVMGFIAIDQAIIATEIQNLSLLPANIDLIGAEVELVSEIGREFKLKAALEKTVSRLDPIPIKTDSESSLLARFVPLGDLLSREYDNALR